MEEIRIQKCLEDNGIESRKKCEEIILQGKVKVNGKIAELGLKVKPDVDKIEYNGKEISSQKKENTYILLNKPIDCVTTVKDQFNRKTVLDLVNIKGKRLVPVRKTGYVYIGSNNINR